MKRTIQAILLLTTAISSVEAGFGRYFMRLRNPFALTIGAFSMRTAFTSAINQDSEKATAQQSSTTKAYDPETISKFKAAYTTARVIGMGVYAQNSGKGLENDEEAAQVYTHYCPKGYCDYVRGKNVKQRFNPPINQCALFSKDHLNRMDSSLQEEFYSTIQKCSLQNESAQVAAATEFSSNADYTVDFAFASPPINYVPHKGKSCKEARDHIRKVAEGDNGSTTIENVRICPKGSFNPYKCQSFAVLSMENAIELLNRCSKE